MHPSQQAPGTPARGRKALSALCRILAAALMAFLVLEGFCRLYFNRPLHSQNPSGATDYIWQAHTPYSVWTEGIGWGRTNNEGYYDPRDYDPETAIDVLVMGSSFLQAEQVPQDRSAPVLLEELLPGQRVYNISIAGHYFLTCAQNLPAAAQRYHPRYIVMETQDVRFPDVELEQFLSGSYPELESENNRLLRLLKQSKCLDLLYYQLTYYRNEHGGLFQPPALAPLLPRQDSAPVEAAVPSEAEEQAAAERHEQLLRRMLTALHDNAAAAGAEVIIVFHPKTWLDGYGGMWMDDAAKTTGFADLCQECGILLLDMHDKFQREYEDQHLLPYGFANTEVGMGHLNVDGHRMLAEELAALIGEVAG